MFYRLGRSVKDGVIDYLRGIFGAYSRDELDVVNSMYTVKFSKTPEVMVINAWERPGGHIAAPGTRVFPVVLIGEVTGSMSFHGFGANDNMGGFVDYIDSPEGNIVLGGEATYTLTIECVARSGPERDNLADITALYLAHPLFARFLFNKYAFQVAAAPKITGESAIEDVNTDFLMYQTSISLDLAGQWRQVTDKLERLEEIIFSPVYVLPNEDC